MKRISNKKHSKILSPLNKKRVELKVCGMKFEDNILEVTNLKPDFMGFIFYEKSPRYFEGKIPQMGNTTKKVGVFVNASVKSIIDKTRIYKLDLIQLHGNESPDFCKELKHTIESVPLIKVFSIMDNFDFNILDDYEDCVEYFLFDTKGRLPGGNGYAFDWKILQNYSLKKPFFLSGGIGLNSVVDLKAFFETEASRRCMVIDINSRFEVKPGLKDPDKVRDFIEDMNKLI